MQRLAQQQSSQSVLQHTMQRHKEILQDHKQEFKKTKTTIFNALNRAQLMYSVQQDNAYVLFSNKQKILHIIDINRGR